MVIFDSYVSLPEGTPIAGWFIMEKPIWLVVDLPLWKLWVNGSMGRIIPYIMENKIHVWNHQPAYEIGWFRGTQETLMFFVFFDDTVDGPAKSESPVENGGKHPIVYRVSTRLRWCRISQRSTVVPPCYSPEKWLFVWYLNRMKRKKYGRHKTI